MILKELTTISYTLPDGLVSFALNLSPDGHFCLTARQSAEILKIDYKSVDDTHVRLLNTTLDLPTFLPTKDFPVDARRVYNSATHQEKQDLCLDSMLLPDIAQIPINIAIISIKWAPVGSATDIDSYCACLTNYGGCSLRFRNASPRYWSPEISNISNIWLTHCLATLESPPIVQFEMLQSFVDAVHITAIAWNNLLIPDAIGAFLACVSASGKFGIFQISPYALPTPAITLELVSNIGLYKVNAMEWFSFHGIGQLKLHSYLCAGDLDGNVTLFEINYGNESMEIVKKLSIWSENDKIRVGKICFEFLEKQNELFILVCKGPFVLCFRFNIKSGELIEPNIHNIKDLSVTSLTKMDSLSYFVTSLGGTIQKLDYNLTTSGTEVTTTNIDCNVNFTNYSLYGACISRNKAFWLLATFPRQPIDHLVHRQPVTISICSLPIQNTVKNLVMNPTFRLTNYEDCAELIRFYCIKTGDLINEKEMKPITENIEISEQYLYQLKLKMVIGNAKAAYWRRKFKSTETATLENQVQSARKTIFAIFYYRQLAAISSLPFDTLSTFQKLSIKCMLRYITDYNETKFEDDYVLVQNTLRDIFNKLINKVEHLHNDAPELCIYCNEFLEPDQLNCRDNHKMPRCCLSMIQVPIINSRHCGQCKAVALDNIDHLRQLICEPLNENEILCPICDLRLEIES